MSNYSNDQLLERVAEVIGTTDDEELRDMLEGYLDTNDLESLYWVVTHLPEEPCQHKNYKDLGNAEWDEFHAVCLDCGEEL